jgi:hypothetical protein
MLEFLLDAGLIQHDIRPMSRFDITVDGEVALRKIGLCQIS